MITGEYRGAGGLRLAGRRTRFIAFGVVADERISPERGPSRNDRRARSTMLAGARR